MVTSANVTEFRIKKGDKIVGTHSQHHYCKTNWDRLCQFLPLGNYTIQAYGLDEHEAPWEDKPINLEDFLFNTANSGPLVLIEMDEFYCWKNTYSKKISQGFSSKADLIIAYHCGCLVWQNE